MNDERDEGGGGILRVSASHEEVRDYYDKISRIYDLLSEPAEGPVRRLALEMLSIRPGETVLEVGPGTGHGLVAIARAVGPEGMVFGIDLSESMLDRAHDLLARDGLSERARLIRGDAEDLPIESGTVDAILMSFTLELFDTPAIPRVLGECLRVLRPAGRIVVVSLSKQEHEGPAVKLFEWLHRRFPALLNCRPIHVREELARAGFRIRAARHASVGLPVEIVLAENPGRNDAAG
ncbi:MAG: methyltransferase domain-containing protein [Planctomycetes bacterium]|nr:methyltransferase domain-containing protein [Planctomycetota bacterium]